MAKALYIDNGGFDAPTIPQPALRKKASCVAEKEVWALKDSPTLSNHKSRTSLTADDFPKEVLEFFNSLPMGRQHAIAGGAIRDMFLGNSPSDYDMYTTMSYDDALSFLYHHPDVAKDFHPRSIIPEGSNKALTYAGNVRYIFEFYIEGVDERIELIGVDNVEDYVCREFSVGTSRAMYTKDGFSATQSFFMDMVFQRITIKNADNLTERYKRKMKVKFNGWGWNV